jgi:hypothetical protein
VASSPPCGGGSVSEYAARSVLRAGVPLEPTSAQVVSQRLQARSPLRRVDSGTSTPIANAIVSNNSKRGPALGKLRCWCTDAASSSAYPQSSADMHATVRRLPFLPACGPRCYRFIETPLAHLPFGFWPQQKAVTAAVLLSMPQTDFGERGPRSRQSWGYGR